MRISSAIASRSASLTVCVLVGPSQSISFAIAKVDGAAGMPGAGSDTTIGAGISLFDGAVSASSPSSLAITVPTATFSAPSSTSNSVTMPSSTASTSIVALSVSISAIKSPERNSSPTFTSHLDRRPSVIVGDKAGILISFAITKIPY